MATGERDGLMLLLLEDRDVVYRLALGIRAGGRGRHRLAIRGDDPLDGDDDLAVLLIGALGGASVDALERDLVRAERGAGQWIILAVKVAV